ncbi:MAG: hypothetical protein QOH51_2395 [Acidobacteriota bacterium]|jgi:hypothetical protein|nr:hypothetical protein [Acidobacteriota bacterium]
MSDSSFSSRAGLAALLLLAIVAGGYIVSHRMPDERAVIEGRFEFYIQVDSEHGELNGWFSEEIVYDVYVETSDGRHVQLWATPDTAFYSERDGDLTKISVRDLKAEQHVRAYVGEIDNSAPRPTAFAVKVIALE